ncbi:protein sax-3-like [Branchiostoma floridae]|uniref:Protein sax-3-like n=1 Tax=Branchiostoma floridae TaxID=7739 RepID=A0A9J7KUR4_BRAFL|nr:protein sax-3-like [Branchiostoma floridae]
MLLEIWKKMPSSGIASRSNGGSFAIFAAWRGRVEPVGEASLRLLSVTKDDVGQYQFSTTFSDGTSDSKERTLIVQFAPEDTTVTATPGLIVQEGATQVVLTCQAGGIPAPTYTWTGDNLPADAAQDPNTGTLTLANIQRAAAGQYTCTAGNGVPQLPGDDPAALTNSVSVQVQYPGSAPTTPKVQPEGPEVTKPPQTGANFSGAVAGAAVGCFIAGLLVGGAAVFLFLHFRTAKNNAKEKEANTDSDRQYENVPMETI